MLSRHSSVLLLVGLALDFVGTALAAPAPAPAPAADPVDMLAGLAPRQGTCPTITSWAHYEYLTTILHSTTITDGISYLGSVTSTQHVTTTVPVTTLATVFSPAVTTLPTTTATPVVATVTTTFTYETTFITATFPGYAPASDCEVTTYTYTHPGTSTLWSTWETSFATVWTTEVGHVVTRTTSIFSTTTRTVTTPGATTWATTVTHPVTSTVVSVVDATSTVSVWASGCSAYACQA
ncbi:hypothetical protein VTK56DRAFT_5919 [Thermocarpiscus australiensis]